jgi:hypothetical protein
MIDCVADPGPWFRIRPFTRLSSSADWEWALDNSCRKFLVRASIGNDHPIIADNRIDAHRMGMKPYELITIVRLRDGKTWILGGRAVGFPQRWKNTDEYARARLAANERAKAGVRGAR